MIKKKVLEYSNGKMGECTKEIGKMVNKMEKDHSWIRMEENRKQNGIKGRK